MSRCIAGFIATHPSVIDDLQRGRALPTCCVLRITAVIRIDFQLCLQHHSLRAAGRVTERLVRFEGDS